MEQGASEFVKYLRVVFKRRYLFVGIAVLVMSGLIAYSYRLPRRYQADSTVFIETSVINNLLKGLAVDSDMAERIRVLKYAILSRDILGKVLAEIGPEPTSDSALQERIASLQKQTEIKVNGKDLFTVSIVSSNPAFAQRYINTLVSKYVEESLLGRRQETMAANQFIDQQLAQVKTNLNQAEDAIIEFRKKSGMQPAGDEQAINQAIADYRKELENLDLSANALKAKKARLQNQLQQVQASTAPGGEQHTSARILALEKTLQQLLLTYTADYPEVVRVRGELDELRRAPKESAAAPAQALVAQNENPVYRELQQKVFDVEAEISALQGRQATIREHLRQRQAELQKVPEQSKQLAQLVQERDGLRKMQEELLARQNQTEVSQQMGVWAQGNTFRVVDAALLPTVPVSPDMVRMILMAIAAGLAAGLGTVLLVDSLDARVKEPAQVRELGLPVLAVVPAIVDGKQAQRRKHLDLLVYSLSGIYLSGVLALLVYEVTKG